MGAEATALLSLRQEARLRTYGLDDGHQVACLACVVEGALDVEAFREALLRIAARHDVLRMSLRPGDDGAIVPTFPPIAAVPVHVEDVPATSEQSIDTLVQRFAAAEQNKPFDLARGPLIRARVARVDERRYVLLLVTEHMIADGLSVQLLCDELGAAYDALSRGNAWEPPPLRRQFPAYAAWQRQLLSGSQRESLVSYWVDQLDGRIPRLRIGDRDDAEPPVELGVMRPTPKHLLKGHFNASDATEGLGPRLAEFCRKERITMFMLGAAATFVLLYKATGRSQTVILSPFAARPSGFDDVIGDFSTPLPLRVEVDPSSSVRTLLNDVRATVLDAIEHEQLPYPELNQVIDNHALPYNRIAYFGAERFVSLRLSDADVSVVEPPVSNTLFDLSCWLMLADDGMTVATLHRSAWFSSNAARRWNDAYIRALSELTLEPDRSVASLTTVLDLE